VTIRRRLMDIDADHVAAAWYELQFPVMYVSTRHVQGHDVTVIVANGEMGRRLLELAERRTKSRDCDEDDRIADG
jgi:hypothetical protein